MKIFMTSLFAFFFSLAVIGQEQVDQSISIPAETDTQKIDLGHSPFLQQSSKPLVFAYFDVKVLHLPSLSELEQKPDRPINILAMAKTREHIQESQLMSPQFLNRQLKSINSKVRVFDFNQSAWHRANDDLHFYGKKTPDGGIKNEVFRDIRPPLLYPYRASFYHPYGRYYSGFTRRPGRLYIYRR